MPFGVRLREPRAFFFDWLGWWGQAVGGWRCVCGGCGGGVGCHGSGRRWLQAKSLFLNG